MEDLLFIIGGVFIGFCEGIIYAFASGKIQELDGFHCSHYSKDGKKCSEQCTECFSYQINDPYRCALCGQRSAVIGTSGGRCVGCWDKTI